MNGVIKLRLLPGRTTDYATIVVVIAVIQFTFASNTATILGGLLVGGEVQLRAISIFIYAFVMGVSYKWLITLPCMWNELCHCSVHATPSCRV